MGIKLRVRRIMTKDIVSVETLDLVMRAINLMVKKNIGSIVVTEDGEPVGILTERDIMKKVCQDVACGRGVRVREIMSKPLITIEANAAIGEAAMLMTKKDIRRLLVEEKGKIVGIITQKDVTRGTLNALMSVANHWIL